MTHLGISVLIDGDCLPNEDMCRGVLHKQTVQAVIVQLISRDLDIAIAPALNVDPVRSKRGGNPTTEIDSASIAQFVVDKDVVAGDRRIESAISALIDFSVRLVDNGVIDLQIDAVLIEVAHVAGDASDAAADMQPNGEALNPCARHVEIRSPAQRAVYSDAVPPTEPDEAIETGEPNAVEPEAVEQIPVPPKPSAIRLEKKLSNAP